MATDLDGPEGPDERPLPVRQPRIVARPLGREDDELPADPVKVVTAGIGLARLTVGATAKLGRWGLGASMRVGNRVIKAAVSGETATTLIDDATHALREQARDLLGIVDEAGRVVGFQMAQSPAAVEARAEQSLRDLRARGSELLEVSADVSYDEPYHPAFARILDELAPDEARMLRLMALEGPQPLVEVRTSSPIPGSSRMIATGLNMLGAEAGVRFTERVPSYLNNLERLGLVWYSQEEVEDQARYQILEAQPDVMDALRAAPRTKTVRGSLRMTAFGRDFARTCLLAA